MKVVVFQQQQPGGERIVIDDSRCCCEICSPRLSPAAATAAATTTTTTTSKRASLTFPWPTHFNEYDLGQIYENLHEYYGPEELCAFPNPAHHQGVCWQIAPVTGKPPLVVRYYRARHRVTMSFHGERDPFCHTHSMTFLTRILGLVASTSWVGSRRAEIERMRREGSFPVITIDDDDDDVNVKDENA